MAAAEAVKAVRLFKIGGFQRTEQPNLKRSQFESMRRERSMPRMPLKRYPNSTGKSSYDTATDDEFKDESFESVDERSSRNNQSNNNNNNNYNQYRSAERVAPVNSQRNTNENYQQRNSNDRNDRNDRNERNESYKNEPYSRGDSLIKEYNKDIQKNKLKTERVDVYEKTNASDSEKKQLTPRNKDGKLFKIR